MTWPVPDPKKPGEESVWDYPRPPRLEPVTRVMRSFRANIRVILEQEV